MKRLLRLLVRAFPEEFRRIHGEELLADADTALDQAARQRSALGLIPLALHLFADFILNLIHQHIQDLRQDLRHAMRTLSNAKTFTLVSVISLGLGIGLATSTYSQFRSTLYRDVPGMAAPDEMATLRQTVSYPAYESLRDESHQFESLASYQAPIPFVVHTAQGPERLWGHIVSPNYFEVIGAKAHLGSVLHSGDRHGEALAVLSHRIWEKRFGGDPAILGRSIRINGQPVTIAGVAQRDFLGASPLMFAADVWLPVTIQSKVAPELSRDALADRKVAAFRIVGKLRAGVSIGSAEAALEEYLRQIEKSFGRVDKDRPGRRATLAPGGRLLPVPAHDLPLIVGFPLVLTILTLWIACANVGTMMVARAAARRKEMAVRLALGARQSRIIRQLLTESTLLAVLGGVLGAIFAAWTLTATDWLKAEVPGFIHLDFQLDWTALLLTAAVSGLAGLFFGLTPAWQASRTAVGPALKAGAVGVLPGYRWFSQRNLLVLQQVAASLSLLLLCGMVILGFERNTSFDLGYEPDNLYSLSIDPIRDGYNQERVLALFDRLADELATTSGVRGVTVAQTVPLNILAVQTSSISISLPDGKQRSHTIRTERVGSGFFDTLGIPILRGRGFRKSDERDDARVTIVNESMARQIWPGEDPVGKKFQLEEQVYEVVGLARDTRSSLILSMAMSGAYLPSVPGQFLRPSPDGVKVIFRTEPGTSPELVRKRITSIDPQLSVFHIQSMRDVMDRALGVVRITTATYSGIGLFGLLLSAAGLAGITAYAVTQRRKEIGIRIALGAQRHDVLGLVMREGAWMVAVGTMFGLAGAMGLAQLLKGYLSLLARVTNTTMTDPVLLIGGPLLLGGLAMVACYLPAQRSTRINPLVALREE